MPEPATVGRPVRIEWLQPTLGARRSSPVGAIRPLGLLSANTVAPACTAFQSA
ncbi:hypothetical protein D3C71_2233460 [compost metagenome]